jgi:hypothetical protein
MERQQPGAIFRRAADERGIHRGALERPHEPVRSHDEAGVRQLRLQRMSVGRNIPRNAIESTLHVLHVELPMKWAARSDVDSFQRFAELIGMTR